MKYSIFALAGLAALASSSAIPQDEKIPTLPNGFFEGSYNDDGTTTLNFTERNEVFTFKPRREPAKTAVRGVEARDTPPFGHNDCWGNELDHDGVDQGFQNFRGLWSGAKMELGSAVGRFYRGYNNNGVYVYFCYNAPKGYDTFGDEDLDFASYWMDSECGPYTDGFYQWDSPSLFGKCTSGTEVCLGSR